MFKDRTILYGMAMFADVDISLLTVPAGVPFNYWQMLTPEVQKLEDIYSYFVPFLTNALDTAYLEVENISADVWSKLAVETNNVADSITEDFSDKGLSESYPVTVEILSMFARQFGTIADMHFVMPDTNSLSAGKSLDAVDKIFEHSFFDVLKTENQCCTQIGMGLDQAALTFSEAHLVPVGDSNNHAYWYVTMNNFNRLKRALKSLTCV